MAKIRVAQIKDLKLSDSTTNTGFATLEVGTTTKEVLTSLAGGAAVNDAETTNGIMTGIAVSGNTITPKYKTFEQLSIYTKTEVDTAITTAINALDATVANINALTNGTTTTDIRVEVVETDGKITAVNVTDTLQSIAHSGHASDVTVTPNGNLTSTNVQAALAELQGDIDSINNQTITAKENQAVEVETENGNTTIGLILGEGEKVLSQTGAGLTTTLTVDIANRTEGEDQTQVTYIQIKGKDGAVVSEVNANAFVKDGFLQSVTKDAANNTLVFTWNTDAGIETTTIAISDLCDVYTAKANDWIQLNGFEFSHKPSTVIGEGEGETKTVGSATGDGVDAAGETVTFKVPSITVDRAGHVTNATESEITVTLPHFVLTVVGEENTELNNSEYVNVKAVKADNSTELTLSSTVKVGSFPTADGELVEGLATVQDVKEYVENNASTTMYRQVLTGVSAIDSEATLTYIPVGDVAITQNGIDLDFGEYTIGGEEGKTVSFNIDEDVAVKPGDVFVAYYMYNPNTQLQPNA